MHLSFYRYLIVLFLISPNIKAFSIEDIQKNLTSLISQVWQKTKHCITGSENGQLGYEETKCKEICGKVHNLGTKILNEMIFDRTLVARFFLGLAIDQIVRGSNPDPTKNISSFLVQAAIGHILFDRHLAPLILNRYKDESYWSPAFIYAFKVCATYLSVQKINDHIHAIMRKIYNKENEQATYPD